MHRIIKIIHLLSLGLWLGSITFFTFFTALPIIGRMRHLARNRPDWLSGLQDEKQGTRLAGEALSAVFDRYFLLQVVCGVVALLTAFCWSGLRGSIPKLRVAVVGGGLLLALANAIYLEPAVSKLRIERYALAPEVAEKAETAFGTWHTYSLAADMLTLLLVLTAFVLGAWLHERKG